MFVEGALPGERVIARPLKQHARWSTAEVLSIEQTATDRQTAVCPHYGQCGGCSLQHLAPASQLHWKQTHLAEVFKRVANLSPQRWLSPISAGAEGYRRRARLAVFQARSGQAVFCGYREAGSKKVVRIEQCPVLEPKLERLIKPLQTLLRALSANSAIEEILMAIDESVPPNPVIQLRGDQPSQADMDRLVEFSAAHHCTVEFRARDRTRVWPENPPPLRCHPTPETLLGFRVDQFVQANAAVNHRMVDRVVKLLQPGSDEPLLDLFCGLGNFSLAMAQRGAEVTGVDLGMELIGDANNNALLNGLEARCRFYSADLMQPLAPYKWARQHYQGVVLDPPRAGAQAVLPLIAACGARRVVYVSCDPATLARDAGVLTHQFGFTLECAGVIDQFPHTGHVESVSLFRTNTR